MLLALVVGITMYQLLQKTSAQRTFDEWMGEIGSGQAEAQLTAFCEGWSDAGFVTAAVNQEERAKATVAAAHPNMAANYFTESEFNAGERLTPCDCAVYLYQKGLMSQLKADQWYDPDECHQMTNSIAETTGLVG